MGKRDQLPEAPWIECFRSPKSFTTHEGLKQNLEAIDHFPIPPMKFK
jgi:hypothetical protein